jgi:transposase-like protein
VSMTGKSEQVEVITSVQRRRRWAAEEKVALVQETYAPGMSVSLVARRHGIAPNQLFTWRRPDLFQGLTNRTTECHKLPASEASDPGDITSERRATSSRNARATSSESAIFAPCPFARYCCKSRQ